MQNNKKKKDCFHCAPEGFNIEYLKENVCGLIGNKKIASQKIITIKSPIDLEDDGRVCAMSANDITNAYEDANKAFSSWSKTSFSQRKKILQKFAKSLWDNRKDLAKLVINHVAKTTNDTLDEIKRSIEYINETILVYEKIIKTPKIIGPKDHKIKNKTGYFTREPIGVVLAITPFNYPVNSPIAKIVPALVSGNTVVFKPATQASIIGIKISELLIKAGLPKGVINCVVGYGNEISKALITNPHISMISFTGGTKVGKELLAMSQVGNVSLELGGKDAAIVLSDADLKIATDEIIKGAFSFSGQRCTAIKRVIVLKSVAKELIKMLKNRIDKLIIGNPIQNPDIVPVVDLNSAEYIESLINDAKKHNAVIEIGGKRERNFIVPTLISKVTEKMRIAWEEQFGPVLPILEVKDINEAIKIHNMSNYGLQASIFTKNEKIVHTITKELEVGSVNWNKSSSRGPDLFPFLGIKDSGIGAPQGIEDTILSMTRYKGLIINK
ncbi:aldehyde dehydrogenase family protein [Mycoplasmoides alvi]|uniref:aldehyde dehydrogenase family protein n=1 Tax=Mycoplasmoides alvi TaxID=78580 RepID=UPI0006965E7B|nr:aldehyde dehydrogenase family protein [Mycoplasmoides alvi]